MAFPTASFSDERRILFGLPGKPETLINSLPLKHNGWKMNFLFGKPYYALFWGDASFFGEARLFDIEQCMEHI